MRDAPRHVAPGGHALRRNQLGHVVEHHHRAFERTFGAASHCHPHQQAFEPPGTADAHLFLRHFREAVAQPRLQRREFGHNLGERPVMARAGVERQHARGGTVEKVNIAPRVEPDHPRGHRRKHRIKQPPALFGLAVILDQGAALALELARHPVENAAHQGDFIVAGGLDHLHVEIARAHRLGRLRKLPDRARKPLGEP